MHEGDFAKVLPALEAGYDVAFFDGNTPVPALHKALHGLLKTGGVLITANLNHGGTADAVHAALFDGKTWQSSAGRRGRRDRHQRQTVNPATAVLL